MGLGEISRSLDWLENSCEQHELATKAIIVHPALGSRCAENPDSRTWCGGSLPYRKEELVLTCLYSLKSKNRGNMMHDEKTFCRAFDGCAVAARGRAVCQFH